MSSITKIKDFFKSDLAGGAVLLLFVILSLIIANTGLGPAFERFLDSEWGFRTGSLDLKFSVASWVNDALMVIFFLLVGLEIKYELIDGELKSLKKASLPILAAIGGAAIPALIYLIFNAGEETSVGWGIPMATDIAFALAVVTALGKRVPLGLKVFLAALAIIDDLLAILVIAFFYTSQLHFTYLAYAAALLLLLFFFNKRGIMKAYYYIIPGIFIWYFVHHSGVHATIAGVLVALLIPVIPGDEDGPLERLYKMLGNPVTFLVLPIFALANTNIHIEPAMIEGIFTPLGLGIIIGLLIGKPIGITLTSKLAVKLGWSVLPTGVTWKHVVGAGMLAGIGFTMSIFISLLSFKEIPFLLSEAKLAILIASFLSAILGSVILISLNKKQTK